MDARESGDRRAPERGFRRVGALGLHQKLVAVPLNRLFLSAAGGAARPTLLAIDAVCPELNAVTGAFPSIRRELQALMQLSARTGLPAYDQIDAGQAAYAGGGLRWSVFFLECFGERPPTARALCPETARVLDQVPDLLQAFFSVLDPRKSIPEHRGPYAGYLRYHLGLTIPREEPPSLIVNGHRYRWQEGEPILFDDSWPHSVENASPEPRGILVVDIRRPLPPLLDAVNRMATGIGARFTYGRGVAARAERFAAELAEQGRQAG